MASMNYHYYNENDPYAAQWLRNLMAAGHIPEGCVDTRSILDVRPEDLAVFTQCHFFAGIGGWPLALKLAGWPVDKPVWTGSCPCQPFSVAGKRKGNSDERHLWPYFYKLISECKPQTVFGEQVASADGRKWLGGNEGLQRVQDAKTMLDVLQKFQGGLSPEMRRMLEDARKETQEPTTPGKTLRQLYEISADSPCEGVSGCGEVQSQAKAYAFQPGFGRHSRATTDNRRGVLSDDGDTSESGQGEDLGQPFPRPDRQQERVHKREHSRGAVLPECYDERVGGGESIRNLESNYASAAVRERGTTVAFGGIIKEAIKFSKLSGVRTDLEAVGYAVGAADLCAAGAGAPHIRQRLFWVADSAEPRLEGAARTILQGRVRRSASGSPVDGLADASYPERRTDHSPRGDEGRNALRSERQQGSVELGECGEDGGVVNTIEPGLEGFTGDGDDRDQPGRVNAQQDRPVAETGGANFWADAELIPCADGKARRIESGTFPLAHGVPARVGKLRAYGNAIVPSLAAQFIEAFLEAAP